MVLAEQLLAKPVGLLKSRYLMVLSLNHLFPKDSYGYLNQQKVGAMGTQPSHLSAVRELIDEYWEVIKQFKVQIKYRRHLIFWHVQIETTIPKNLKKVSHVTCNQSPHVTCDPTTTLCSFSLYESQFFAVQKQYITILSVLIWEVYGIPSSTRSLHLTPFQS